MHFVLFGCIRDRLVALRNSLRTKLVQKFVPRSRVRIFRNECTQSTSLDPKLMFHSISYYFGAFGPFGCVTKHSAKRAKLMQKFVPRSGVGFFLNKRNRSTPLHSKLLFLMCIVLFGCIWDRFAAVQNSVQNGPNWWKSSCHEVAS